MAADFSRVLKSETANFAHRSCVLEALALGAPLPQLQPELMAILLDASAPFAERSYALDALAKFGSQTKADIVRAYKNDLGQDADGLRLRAEIIAQLYHGHFGPADLATFLSEVLRSDGNVHIGSLRRIAAQISSQELVAILDATPQTEKKGRSRSERRNACRARSRLGARRTRSAARRARPRGARVKRRTCGNLPRAGTPYSAGRTTVGWRGLLIRHGMVYAGSLGHRSSAA
jgi:hypothetical protein